MARKPAVAGIATMMTRTDKTVSEEAEQALTLENTSAVATTQRAMEHNTRKLVAYPHLNAAGNLFGGQALAWIDEEAAIFAVCQTNSQRLVTVKMSTVEFTHPGHLGDILTIGCALVKKGTTSITVACEIKNISSGNTIVQVDEIVFVNLDENGAPKSWGQDEDEDAR